MPTIAALYDIHGNLPAFDAVLAEIREAGVDEIVIGGDVYPGPMADAVIDRLAGIEIPWRAISGNGERAVLESVDKRPADALPAQVRELIDWTAAALTPERERIIRAWPPTLAIDETEAGRILFVHATPANDTDVFTAETPDAVLEKIFASVDADVVLCGHTHVQFDRYVGRLRVVNAGSVGMPFQAPGAYWALIGSRVELRRTEYDRIAASEVIARQTYPGAADFAQRFVRGVSS